MLSENWKRLGEIGVDSGQVIVTDPCYLGEWKNTGHKEGAKGDYSYGGACQVTLASPPYGELRGGAAFATATRHGDGSYGVYALFERGAEKGSRPRAILVDFDNLLDEEDQRHSQRRR